jgi:hypothetical protein
MAMSRGARVAVLASAAAATAFVLAPVTAHAAPPTDACWGVVSSQLASQTGTTGEHASQQAVPRLGLGNLARELGFDSMGEFGSFLASVDEHESTFCG